MDVTAVLRRGTIAVVTAVGSQGRRAVLLLLQAPTILISEHQTRGAGGSLHTACSPMFPGCLPLKHCPLPSASVSLCGQPFLLCCGRLLGLVCSFSGFSFPLPSRFCNRSRLDGQGTADHLTAQHSGGASSVRGLCSHCSCKQHQKISV